MNKKEPARGVLPALPPHVLRDIETVVKNNTTVERTLEGIEAAFRKHSPAYFATNDPEDMRDAIRAALEKYPNPPNPDPVEENLYYENGEYRLGQSLKDLCDIDPVTRGLIEAGPGTWRFREVEQFISTLLNVGMRTDEVDGTLNGLKCRVWESLSTEYKGAYLAEKCRKAEYKGQIKSRTEYGVPIEYDELYELHFTQSGDVKNIVFYYEEMADKIQGDLCALSFKDRVYTYEDGVYMEGEDKVKSEIARIFKGIKTAKRGFKASVKSADSEILYYIKYNEPCSEWPFNNHEGMIPVNNGILKLDFAAGQAELIPHSPEYKFNYKIPIDYDPGADTGPIDSILRSYVEGEDVNELYQIPAQAMLQASGHAPFKKCYLLQGRPDAGKSTYLELLYRTFGKENKSDISLEDLNPSVHRYKTAGLIGKLFNIHDDLQSFPMKDTGSLKKLTGAYSHDVEIKGVQPFQAELKAVYMFACNDPPKIKNNDVKKDEAFWSRWEYVRFPNHFEKDTTFYDRAFTPENLSGFLLSVVKAALKIGKENRLLCESDYYEVRDTWAKCSEPVYQFITENMERSQAGQLMYFDKDEMFKLVQEWGEYKQLDADDLPPSKERLTQVLEICGVNASKPTSKRTGTQVPAYAFPYKWRAESIWEGKINQIELQREQAKFK